MHRHHQRSTIFSSSTTVSSPFVSSSSFPIHDHNHNSTHQASGCTSSHHTIFWLHTHTPIDKASVLSCSFCTDLNLWDHKLQRQHLPRRAVCTSEGSTGDGFHLSVHCDDDEASTRCGWQLWMFTPPSFLLTLFHECNLLTVCIRLHKGEASSSLHISLLSLQFA